MIKGGSFTISKAELVSTDSTDAEYHRAFADFAPSASAQQRVHGASAVSSANCQKHDGVALHNHTTPKEDAPLSSCKNEVGR